MSDWAERKNPAPPHSNPSLCLSILFLEPDGKMHTPSEFVLQKNILAPLSTPLSMRQGRVSASFLEARAFCVDALLHAEEIEFRKMHSTVQGWVGRDPDSVC